jgi:hypothetical protein
MSGALRDDDIVELGELLEFLHDVLGHSPGVLLEARLARLTGGAYTLDELQADLARFAYLLGGDGDRLVHGADR